MSLIKARLSVKIGNDRKLMYSSCMVIKLNSFKNLLSLLHGCHIPQLQNIAIPGRLSHPTISKFYQPLTMEFFWIPLFCFEICRNYMSIIITIASNITVLVSQNIIIFRFFLLMSHGVNKKTSSSAFPHLHPATRFSPGLFVVL